MQAVLLLKALKRAMPSFLEGQRGAKDRFKRGQVIVKLQGVAGVPIIRLP